MRYSRAILLALTIACVVNGPVVAQAPDIRGSWHAETYLLKEGTRHPVKGLIFFTAKDWTVLFFVTPEGQGPQQGAGEGGTYTLSGDALTFTHIYNLSAGKALAGLPESPLQMTVKDGTNAGTEACRVNLQGDRLTIHFPSGNQMMFRKSSGF